ncbi:hypothetical protein NCCP1664_25910 [Zafaria cholistanensis]|uniref:Uncharacterized protein n=1 Tax=Zafaria cholistanensis TaxID=1682741 RepID=A0A5A7NU02_9MICC|nr:hypothetical protein [Zafaria cholistanensis]GER24096.1 hypothetical protein NCCP1664_25910 [Zafaria cholistanensis]
MKNPLASAIIGPDGKPVAGVQGAVLNAVSLQRPLVLAYLRRMRRRHPQLNAAQLAELVERDFMLAVTGGGAAVGASAVVPGIGTAASLGLSAAAVVGFLEASALYAQSLAELHGIATDDPEKSRALVMSILLGDEGSALISQLTHQAVGKGIGPVRGWGSVFGSKQPAGLWGVASAAIQKKFMRHLLATQGAAFFGRAIPFGIGAVVGGAGNRILGKQVVRAARLAFGPLPTSIPGEVVEAPRPATPGTEPRHAPAHGAGSPAALAGEPAQGPAAEVEALIEAERARRAGQ